MNFKKLTFLIFLFSYMSFYAQEKSLYKKPNYRRIKKIISKKKSNFYYPKLMKSYLNSRSSMTLEEKRHLYYGYALQKKYKPYADSKYKSKVRNQLRKRIKTKLESNELLNNINMHLLDNPFDIAMLGIKVYAYKRLKDEQGVLKVKNQIDIIKKAIVSSGNGKTKSKAFYVIYTSHEEELLKILGYKKEGRRTSIQEFEYIKLATNSNHIKGLYFNLSQGEKSVNKFVRK